MNEYGEYPTYDPDKWMDNYRKKPSDGNEKNPYQKYIINTPKKRHYQPDDEKISDYHKTPINKASRPASSIEAELWKKVKQVWDDCQALGWDEEDTAEALFGIVEELINGLPTEDK